MTELTRVKKKVDEIIQGESVDFTVLSHDYLSDDIWSITVKSNNSEKLYSFKDDGFEFFDFKEKENT